MTAFSFLDKVTIKSITMATQSVLVSMKDLWKCLWFLCWLSESRCSFIQCQRVARSCWISADVLACNKGLIVWVMAPSAAQDCLSEHAVTSCSFTASTHILRCQSLQCVFKSLRNGLHWVFDHQKGYSKS